VQDDLQVIGGLLMVLLDCTHWFNVAHFNCVTPAFMT
jgi:hypothetical protein